MNVSKLLLALVILAVSTVASRTAEAARPACAPDATWAVLDGAVANVRVWYDQSNPAALTEAQAIIAALDTTIWPTLITGLGFNAPLSDLALVCNGGDARLDIFVVAGSSATTPETGAPNQDSTYLQIRSGLSGSALQYTLTHYFMHAVEWAYVMVSPQLSYGWMRNALANWAVEAVYPGNTRLKADASCHMNSTFLPITSVATGWCTNSASRSRDYGAYLLYQYIGRTYGNAKVRELLAATTVSATALDAIDTNVTGGLKALWSKYARTLWNQAPITRGARPSYKNWDGLTTTPELALDQPTTVNADLSGVAEAVTSLSPSVENVSTRIYHFTFSDVGTRSLMFHNTFYPLYKAGKKVSAQAMWRKEDGGWEEENWSNSEYIGLCRDFKSQRVAELVIVIASGETGPVTQIVAPQSPTLRRNNIGCWGFIGDVKRSERRASWSSGTIVANAEVYFTLKPNNEGTVQYTDFGYRLRRVPIAAPLFNGAFWNLVENYRVNPCGYALTETGFDDTILFGGSGFGNLVINNFAESLPGDVRSQQYALIGSVRGAYLLQAASQRFNLPGTVTGPQPDCGTQYFSALGMFVLSGDTAGTGKIIALDGHLRGNFVPAGSDGVTFNWDLAPVREP